MVSDPFVRRILLHTAVATCCVLGLLLLPLLRLSGRARQWFFVRQFAVVTRLWRGCFEDVRRDVLRPLNEMQSHDAGLRAEGAIRVLEVGAGFGSNFSFIRRKVKYWNVDPNTEFQSAFLDTLKKYPKVEMERWVAGYGEDMRQVPDAHFDVVLTTHLLCSVSCTEKVLQECRRVLVKGGRLLFMEHVAHPQGSLGWFLQKLITPLWRFLWCGCCPNRYTADVIRGAGFAQVHMKEALLDLPIILSRHVYGSAVA